MPKYSFPLYECVLSRSLLASPPFSPLNGGAEPPIALALLSGKRDPSGLLLDSRLNFVPVRLFLVRTMRRCRCLVHPAQIDHFLVSAFMDMLERGRYLYCS